MIIIWKKTKTKSEKFHDFFRKFLMKNNNNNNIYACPFQTSLFFTKLSQILTTATNKRPLNIYYRFENDLFVKQEKKLYFFADSPAKCCCCWIVVVVVWLRNFQLINRLINQKNWWWFPWNDDELWRNLGKRFQRYFLLQRYQIQIQIQIMMMIMIVNDNYH